MFYLDDIIAMLPEDVNGSGGVGGQRAEYFGITTSIKRSRFFSSWHWDKNKAVAWRALQTGFTYNYIVNPLQLHGNSNYRIRKLDYIDLNSLTHLTSLSISIFSLGT